MIKKLITLIVGVFCLGLINNVYAGNGNGLGEFKITDSDGNEKTTFSFGETPFITIESLGGSEGNIGGQDKIGSWWVNSNNGNNIRTDILYSDADSLITGQILSLETWGGWGPTVFPGVGEYSVKLTNFSGPKGLSVTPEPISSVLFLIGGGALAFFRKKIKV